MTVHKNIMDAIDDSAILDMRLRKAIEKIDRIQLNIWHGSQDMSKISNELWETKAILYTAASKNNGISFLLYDCLGGIPEEGED